MPVATADPSNTAAVVPTLNASAFGIDHWKVDPAIFVLTGKLVINVPGLGVACISSHIAPPANGEPNADATLTVGVGYTLTTTGVDSALWQ